MTIGLNRALLGFEIAGRLAELPALIEKATAEGTAATEPDVMKDRADAAAALNAEKKALEEKVAAQDKETRVAIYMENTGQIAIATVQTPGGRVRYDGDASIDGVPGTAAPIPLEFRDTAGSSCGALLPTGNAFDEVEGDRVTLIDNGMPCVVMKAQDVGIIGYEDRDTLDQDAALKSGSRRSASTPRASGSTRARAATAPMTRSARRATPASASGPSRTPTRGSSLPVRSGRVTSTPDGQPGERKEIPHD